MWLEHDGCYVATVNLGFFEKMAGNETIAQKLAAAGFRNVQVQGNGKTRSASGIWAGESMDVEPEEHLSDIKRIL